MACPDFKLSPSILTTSPVASHTPPWVFPSTPNLSYFSYRPLSSVLWSMTICQTPGGRLLDISSPRQPTLPCRVLSPPSTPPSHEYAGTVPMPLLVPILLATFAAPSHQSLDTTSWQRTALSFLKHTQTPHSPTQVPTPSLVNPRPTLGCSSLFHSFDDGRDPPQASCHRPHACRLPLSLPLVFLASPSPPGAQRVFYFGRETGNPRVHLHRRAPP
jgi:hypothetical protein